MSTVWFVIAILLNGIPVELRYSDLSACEEMADTIEDFGNGRIEVLNDPAPCSIVWERDTVQ